MKITIKDIAKIADVSTTTVSKIINEKDHSISEKTRQKVLNIMKELNYEPNTIARSLVTKKTKTLGLLIPDITNPFFPELVRGAEDRAREDNYSIIFCNTDDKKDKELMYAKILINKMVDGIMLVPSIEDKYSNEDLDPIKVPLILVDRDLSIPSSIIRGSVTCNCYKGSYEATMHLLNQGLKEIAFISAPLNNVSAKHRFEGYKDALNKKGITVNPNLVFLENYKQDFGKAVVEKIIDENLKVDSFFCGNDLLALGVLSTLKYHHIHKKFPIVGFDDISITNLVSPTLSSVKQPTYEMGYEAANMMIELLKDENKNFKKIILDTKLMIRESSNLEYLLSQI